MRVRLILRGYGEITYEGSPAEVLPKADEVVASWKVMWHGEKAGEGR